jgi:hydrophobe/amphiphile efflux-1 (HAE1) family protein
MRRFLGGFFDRFNRFFDYTNRKYTAALRKVIRISGIALAVYGGLLVLTYFGFRTVPTAFIPQQDQGYILVSMQGPDASSITRTQETMAELSELARSIPGVRNAFAISGVSIVGFSSSSSAGVMFVSLDPFDERAGIPERSAQSIMNQLKSKFAAVQTGSAMVIPPPPIRGIGNAGGFKLQIQDRSGESTPQELQAAVDQFMTAARKRPEVTGIFSSFRASVPQLFADVDREKVKNQNIAVTDVFQALQVFLGGFYINDFNYLGRVWRVLAQADAEFRDSPEDISQISVRNQAGQMVPIGSILTVQSITGPDRIQRYNLFRSAEVNGSTAPGYSSGQAISAMEELAREVLPPQFDIEWTELAYQEKLAGNTALLIFPLCVLFVWLAHSAEYESFALSTAIILIVPMCLLCGIAGVWLRGMDNNIFTQIGFLVLAGMSVKNAVLIVEFAKQQQERNPDMSPAEAAIEASRLRLRPILMTSFAFIFGVLPLVIASGAGAEMRQSLGTVVFYGMIGVTFFGVFFTPVFYYLIRTVLPFKPHPRDHTEEAA